MTKKEKLISLAPQPHVPELLPLADLSFLFSDKEVISLIAKANNSLGAYKGFLMNSLNPMLLISPLISQEAVLSSKMEGTHATIEDLFTHQ